jgi:predicted GIY-YIG superfamily endonuclease
MKHPVQQTVMHYVYLLESHADPSRHYVGVTAELKTRLGSHNAGQNPSTASHRPWNLAAYIAIPSEPKAHAFERYLKGGSGRTFAKRHLL